MPLKVVVVGATGRMGRETVRALCADPEFELAALIGRSQAGRNFADLEAGGPNLQIGADLAEALERTRPDAVIDYSPYQTAVDHAGSCIDHQTPFVFGMTGISDEDVISIRGRCEIDGVPGMIVPNFSIGAVLMMRFAEIAAQWLPDCEIIEMHHERKADAPSGTAMLTARRIADARDSASAVLPPANLKVEGARGGNAYGIPVHSVRLPGLLAHQMVLFGETGEVLTLRHDSMDRVGFMPGVKLCLQGVADLTGLTIGMDALLGL